MFKSLGTEFKVGLFTLVALATLAYMFFVLSPSTFERKEYHHYYTVLGNAAGIFTKTHVMTAGVSIGRVKAVKLDGTSTRVELEIDAGVKIPLASKIEIRSVGLLGDKHLEIIRPADGGTFIDDGGLIPQSTDGADLESLIAVVSAVAKDVKKVTATLAQVFGNEAGQKSIQEIVDNIHGITADVKASTATLKEVVGGRQHDLQEIVSNVRDGTRDLKAFSADLKQVLNKDNRDKVDRILASFDTTMVDVRSSAKNVSLISEKIERGEGTIGKLVNDDSTLTELEGAIKDIRKVLAPATKLEIEADYHGEIRRDKTAQHYFNIYFRTRPDRFYMLGLTDTRYERKETRTVVSGDPANPDAPKGGDNKGGTVTQERITDDKALRFNAQVGKRWYFTTVRFGLFETTGGIAADFHLWEDRLKLSAEAFDWDTKDKTLRRNAHLKTYASVLFYNHIYAMAGVDDLTRTDPQTGKVDKTPNVFGGAGFSFNDQDLKAIFGTAALAR